MLPKEKNALAVSRPNGGSGDSKSLARWVPRLMDLVADALCRQAFNVVEEIKCKAMTWAEHCAAGHVPFRRDCRVCQETSAKGRPHRKVAYPLNGTLSVDVAGPLKKAKEMFWAEGGGYMQYILVGAFTWLKPKGGDSDPPDVHAGIGEEELPELADDEAEEDPIPADGEGGEEPEGERLDGDAPEEEKVEERQEPELNIFRFCIPLQGKTKDVVLRAINELYIQLRVHGYTVTRLHSDRGGEFRGKGLDQWCRTRDIHRTKTAGMSPQSNGRVERSVQEIKARIQRALKGAAMGPEFWPAACRFVHQQERRRLALRGDRPTPPFGKEILIKKRYWKRGDLEDTHETALYMYQDYENHGHCVLKNDGTYAIAPYYIAHVTQPLDDSVWIAVLEEIDKDRNALAVRRRLREKTAGSIAKLQMMSTVEEWNIILAVDEAVDLQKKEREEHEEALRNVLEEEGRIMVMDGLESMMSTFEEIRKIKKALPQGSEEEDVLRTRIVSVRELLDEREKWTAAIQTELDQLFIQKRALEKIDEGEFEELQRRFGNRLTVVPMKCVLTKKPGPKRRFRIVACGNYAEKTSDDTYAAGADAVSVRYALKKAAESSWSGVVIDVKTAFLNAPLYESELAEEAVVIKPPSLLLKLGFARQGEYYKAEKAIYGLRQSPKRWGDFRDQRMLDMVTPSGYYFRQSVAEPNMWKVLKKTAENEEQDEILGELHGLILVYVDDMLILALLEVLEEVISTIQKEWATSAPEYLRRGKIKYLGMELYETDQGFFACQEDYVVDHLNSRQQKPKPQKCPTIPDMYPEAEDEVDQGSVTRAQQTVGELLWVSTRTRPEISFAVSRCSEEIIRSPKWVCTLVKVIRGYLSLTTKEGLWFRKTGGGKEGHQQAYRSTRSPSGSGAISHGCIMVTWNQGLLWWRCSRQAFVTMSTAESELMEAIEGLALGDAVDTLVSEHEREYTKRLWVDNAAAVSVLSTNPSSWRTRHLRLRSHHLQWRLASADWLVAFLPGRFQVSDLGTKHLPAQRALELKELLGMGRPAREDETAKKMTLVGAMSLGSMTLKGMDTDDGVAPEGSGLDAMLVVILVIYTVAVVTVTLLTSWWCRWRSYMSRREEERLRGVWRSPGGSNDDEDHVEDFE